MKNIKRTLAFLSAAAMISQMTVFNISANEVAEQIPEEETSEDFMYGDLNLDNMADMTDMSMLSLHLLKDKPLSDIVMTAADVMYDMEVNLGDLSYFKQYVEKKRDTLGKDALKTETDITDRCREYNIGGDLNKYNENDYSDPVLISSMDEYTEFMAGVDIYASDIIEDAENISEKFFENNRLVIWGECCKIVNDTKITCTSVKESDDGNITLSYEAVSPRYPYELGGASVFAVVIPDNPHKECSVQLFINEITYMSGVIKDNDIIIEGDSVHCDTEKNVILNSMEEYLEYTEPEWRRRIREDENMSFVNEEYFKKRRLVIWCDNTNAVNGVEFVPKTSYIDSLGNIRLGYERIFPKEMGNEKRTTYFVRAEGRYPGCTESGLLSFDFTDIFENHFPEPFSEVGILGDLFTATKEQFTGNLIISSMNEYNDYIEKYYGVYRKFPEDKLGVDEKFFENNRLAVWADRNNIVNGIKIERTSATVSENGDISLTYDRITPSKPTELAGLTHIITFIPGNPHKECNMQVVINDKLIELEYKGTTLE